MPSTRHVKIIAGNMDGELKQEIEDFLENEKPNIQNVTMAGNNPTKVMIFYA